MKNNKALGLAIVIFGASICLEPCIALDRDKTVADCAGEVVSVSGSVYVRQDQAGRDPASLKHSPSNSSDMTEVKPGNNIYENDVINTGSDGKLKILLKDKTIVDIGPSSLLKMSEFKLKSGANRQVNMDMQFGKMRLGVTKKLDDNGKFKIKTRAATMGVRGTEFVVSSPLQAEKTAPPQTEVTVLQGKVDFVKSGSTDTKAIPLNAGTSISSTTIASNNTPIKLNNSQMANVASSSRVSDNTFTKSVTIEPVVQSHSTSTSPNQNSNSTASNSSSNNGNNNSNNGNSSNNSNSNSSSNTSSTAQSSSNGNSANSNSGNSTAASATAAGSANNPNAPAAALAGNAGPAPVAVNAPVAATDPNAGRGPASDGSGGNSGADASNTTNSSSAGAAPGVAANAAGASTGPAPALAPVAAPPPLAPAAMAPPAPAGSLQGIISSVGGIAPAVPISFSNIGVPGAPSVATVAAAPVQQVKSSYHLTVNVVLPTTPQVGH